MNVTDAAEQTADAAQRTPESFTETPLFEGLARAGYVARGVIYALIGLLAIRLARRRRRRRAPTSRAPCTRSRTSGSGTRCSSLTAIGLGGYALWRLAQALIGHTPEYGEHSALDRIGAAGSFVAYAAFFVLAIGVLRGTAGNSSAQPRKTAAGVLGWPARSRARRRRRPASSSASPPIQAYLGLSKKFLDYSKTGQMSHGRASRLHGASASSASSRAPSRSRLIGVFVLKAARDYTPKDAVGIDGALARLAQHAYGTAALIVVACGLIAFGAYSIADARYRKI